MERSTVQSCLAAPVFLLRKPYKISINSVFVWLQVSAISAIPAGTDQESVCQLTQNWHNGSHFVRSFKQCRQRPFRCVRQGPLGAVQGLLRVPSGPLLRVIERDPEASGAVVMRAGSAGDVLDRGDCFSLPRFAASDRACNGEQSSVRLHEVTRLSGESPLSSSINGSWLSFRFLESIRVL
jgi:hypothetical protein